jgi:hypothetical protein
VRRSPVASSAANFLKVLFQRAGGLVMDDMTMFGLSSPMPKALVATMIRRWEGA